MLQIIGFWLYYKWTEEKFNEPVFNNFYSCFNNYRRDTIEATQ